MVLPCRVTEGLPQASSRLESLYSSDQHHNLRHSQSIERRANVLEPPPLNQLQIATVQNHKMAQYDLTAVHTDSQPSRRNQLHCGKRYKAGSILGCLTTSSSQEARST
eukprot:scaffold48863_cov48-Attheya_sp.AAC.2